jgi:hypothetical protein
VSNIVKTTPLRKIPAEITKLLGEPILWRDESRENYDAMLLGIAISVGANDIVDWLSVKDVPSSGDQGRVDSGSANRSH